MAPSLLDNTASTPSLPVIIQGGMGAAVSSWQLAATVAQQGQLGMVSGTALDAVIARRLQDGDPGGHMQRALAAFPLPDVAQRVVDRYYRPEGRGGAPYLPTPRPSLRNAHGVPSHSDMAADELSVVSNFVEVWLAKQGHNGLVGINYLEKIQMATPAAAFGAILAGADYVIMGAGIPREIPSLLTDLAAGRTGTVHVDVIRGAPHPQRFDPQGLLAGNDSLPTLQRPTFLAIVTAHPLAQYLVRDEVTRPDGFVVESPVGGGHNAPPRGRMHLDDAGQPIYGPRDDVDLLEMAALGLPFWQAGGCGSPDRLRQAREAGAQGVQIGTLFALSRESGMEPGVRQQLVQQLREGTLRVRTDPVASPTGFPFKVVQLEGTVSQPEVYQQRPRLCDLGYLRVPYARGNGGIGYRCPAEPVDVYVRKGGEESDTHGCACICNGLTETVGLGQTRKDGYHEAAIITLGSDLAGAHELAAEYWSRSNANDAGWSAADVVSWVTSSVMAPA